MKKHLNYFGSAFDPIDITGKKTLKKVKKAKKIKKRLKKELKRDGYDSSELWDLDVTFAKFILPRLKGFRDRTISYPSTMETFEEWSSALDEMIYGFENAIEDSDSTDYDRLRKGLELFGKYYRDLWI